MEIRNNTPSFGMAFKKPSAEAMEQFTEYVTRKGAASAGIAKRGVQTLVKRHANDKHFDIEFQAPSRMRIVPKTAVAGEMMEGEMLPEVLYKRGAVDKIREKYFSDAFDETFENASGIKKAWLVGRKVAACIRGLAIFALKPVESLPTSMKTVSRKTQVWEEIVNDRLAQIAKDEAKRAKAIDAITSAFNDPKVSKK